MARRGASQYAPSGVSGLTKKQQARLNEARGTGWRYKALVQKFRSDNEAGKRNTTQTQPKRAPRPSKGGNGSSQAQSAQRSQTSAIGRKQSLPGSWSSSFSRWALPSTEPTRTQLCSLRQLFTMVNASATPNPVTTQVDNRAGTWFVGTATSERDSLWFFPTANDCQLVISNAPYTPIWCLHNPVGNALGYKSDPVLRSPAFSQRIRILQARYTVVVQGPSSTVGNMLLHRIAANVAGYTATPLYTANQFSTNIESEMQTTRVISLRGGSAKFTFEAWMQNPNRYDSYINSDLSAITPANLTTATGTQGILAYPAVGEWALGGYVLRPQAVSWGTTEPAPVVTVYVETVVQMELTMGNDHLATNTPQIMVEDAKRGVIGSTTGWGGAQAPRVSG